jgi:dTDP-4-dehydrorhamnose reductase
VKVVLLGADGQLGTDLRSTAAEAGGVDVLALGRDQLDVTDGDALRTKLGETPFDVIVNCTSYHRTDDAEQHAQLAVDVNAHAVAALAGICAERGARLFHISTDYVFDGRRSTPYLEDDPIGPVNVSPPSPTTTPWSSGWRRCSGWPARAARAATSSRR